VTGIDMSDQLLTHAEETAEQSGFSERVSFRQGDMNNLPFDNDSFDWMWSADCAGYAPGEPLSLLREFARVVRPGGTVAILAWSSQQLLPGHPLLEARLNATSTGIAPFARGTNPKRHFLRAIGWFREAGFEDVVARTFVGDIGAPLSDDTRAFVISLFDMRWGNPESELSGQDLAEYRRLTSPESPDFIADLPEYYAFFTYSLFHGTVSG
jgi:demethylmenaquinone methyltransferase/2-methoxy-6-polyprenyl-1,4-benzoquinol methylase